jgi:hypothetical protein
MVYWGIAAYVTKDEGLNRECNCMHKQSGHLSYSVAERELQFFGKIRNTVQVASQPKQIGK